MIHYNYLMQKDITIVGSGLVGSLIAIYLAKNGHKVSMFEGRPDMRQTKISAGRSINLALSDRGLKALQYAGISQQIKKISIPMYGRQIHLQNGTEVFQAYGKENQAINSVSRGGINIALMNLAQKYQNVKINFQKKCLDIDIKTATTKFLNLNTNEQQIKKSDIVIGCDGSFSAVRRFLQNKTDLFNYSQQFLEHGYKQLYIPPGPNGEYLIKKNALHIWPRKSFMMIALPNLDGSFTCTLFFKLKGEQSFQSLNNQQKLMIFFQKYFSDVIPLMPTLKNDFFTNPTSSLVTIRCFPWSYQDKICLIGDSAHGIVPFFGQGMNCGFEDCTVFNQLMKKHNSQWKLIFQQFQSLRKPNTDAVAQLALDNFIQMRDKTGDPKFLLRKKIESRIAQQNPSYLSMYVQVTFSPHISYQSAHRQGQRQTKYLHRLVQIQNIFEKWNEVQVQQIIKQLVQGAENKKLQ